MNKEKRQFQMMPEDYILDVGETNNVKIDENQINEDK